MEHTSISELDSALEWLEDESVQPSYDTMRKLCIRLARKPIAAIRAEAFREAADRAAAWVYKNVDRGRLTGDIDSLKAYILAGLKAAILAGEVKEVSSEGG